MKLVVIKIRKRVALLCRFSSTATLRPDAQVAASGNKGRNGDGLPGK